MLPNNLGRRGLLPDDPVLRRQTAVIILVNALLLSWLVFRPAPHTLHVAVDELVASLGPLLMPIWAVSHLLRRNKGGEDTPSRARFWAPLFLSLGSFFYGTGTSVWTYLEVFRHQNVPFPSLADAGYIVSYPFLFAGVLMIPLRPVPGALRGRVLLDSLMIMAAMVTFSWYFILGPTIEAGGATLLAKVLSPAYPLLDLVLLCCVLLLSAHTDDGAMRPVVRALSVGLGMVVIGDTIFGYEGLQNSYVSGGVLDITWPVGYMLVTLAASMMGRMPPRHSVADGDGGFRVSPVLWRALLPYAVVPPIGVLLWYTLHRHGGQMREIGVLIGSGVLIGLILLRQVFALIENSHLNRFLRDAYTELETNNARLAAANARLEGLAVTDGLTGLKNHRAFQEQLEKEFQRAARHGTPLSLLLLDVDRFKLYNDTFGHPAGDGVLQKVALALETRARSSDFVARYGGEEFVVLLPQEDTESALAAAEGFRAAVAGIVGVERPVTASIGAATQTLAVASGADLLARADAALYRAKREGRDRVCHDLDAPVEVSEDRPRVAS